MSKERDEVKQIKAEKELCKEIKTKMKGRPRGRPKKVREMSPISTDKESLQVEKDKIETAKKHSTKEFVEDKRGAEQNKARQTSKSKNQEKKGRDSQVESRYTGANAESSKKKIVDSNHFLCLRGTEPPSQRPTSKGIKKGDMLYTSKIPHVEKTKITEELVEIEYSTNFKEPKQLRERNKSGGNKEGRKVNKHEEKTGKNRTSEDRKELDELLSTEHAEGLTEKNNLDFFYDPAIKERPKGRPKSKDLREINKQQTSKTTTEYVQQIGDSQFTKELVETENTECLKEKEETWQKPYTKDNEDLKKTTHTKEHLGDFQGRNKTKDLAKNFRDTVQLSKRVDKEEKTVKLTPVITGKKQQTDNHQNTEEIIDTKCLKGSKETGPTKGRPKSKVCPPTPEDFCKIPAPLPLGSKHLIVPMSRLKDTGYMQVDKKGTFKKQLAANYLEESFRSEGGKEYVTPTQAVWMEIKRQQWEQRRIQIEKRKKRNKKRKEMLGGQRRSRRQQRLSVSDDDTQSDDEFDRPTPQLSKRSKSEDTQSEDEVFVNPLPPLPKRKLKKGYCWDIQLFPKESITFHEKRGRSKKIQKSKEEEITEEPNQNEYFDKLTKTIESKEPNISIERKGGMYEALILKKQLNAINQQHKEKDITSLVLEREMLISQRKVTDTMQIVPEFVTDDGKGETIICHEIVIEQTVDSIKQYPDSRTKTEERETMMDQEDSYNDHTRSREGSIESIDGKTIANIGTEEKEMLLYQKGVLKKNIDASQKDLYSGNETCFESGPMEDKFKSNISTKPKHLPNGNIQDREKNTENEKIRENILDFDQGPSANITQSVYLKNCEKNILLVEKGKKSLKKETNIIQENISKTNMTRLNNISTISGPPKDEDKEVLPDSSSIGGQLLKHVGNSITVKETLPGQSVESTQPQPSTSKQAKLGSFEETMGIIDKSSVELQKKKRVRHTKSNKDKKDKSAPLANHNEADDLQFCTLVSY